MIVAYSEQAGHLELWHFFMVSLCTMVPLVAAQLITPVWVVKNFFFASLIPELVN